MSNDTSTSDLLKDWLRHDDVSFHYFTPTEAAEIRQALLKWYRTHRRKLPWRGDPPPWEGSTVDFDKNAKQKSVKDYFSVKSNDSSQETTAFPVTGYGVWVSEIMLQQTRVEAVIPYWIQWMKTFPTVHDLAAAHSDTVNAHWAGLGFYRRARLLHHAAEHVVEKLDGKLPETVEGLMQLPGIGRYTASAVASIAYNVSVPVVDGNVCRVLARLRAICQHVKAPALKDDWGWKLAAQIVSNDESPGEINQALMELGATYCAPSGTGVEAGDPLKDFYYSTQLGREFWEASKNGKLSELLEKMNTRNDDKYCPLCATNGVPEATSLLESALDDASGSKSANEPMTLVARKCGHSTLPLPPPKMAKREEVLAVAAISCRCETTNQEARLLVRRPEKGVTSGSVGISFHLRMDKRSRKTKRKTKGHVG